MKGNERKVKGLLTGDKFMPWKSFKTGFTLPVDHLIKTKKGYINLKNQEIQDIFNGDSKDLDSDKVLHNRVSHIDKNLKYGGYQTYLASMIFKFFDKIFGTFEKTGISPDNQQLAKEFRKLIFKRVKKHEVPFSCGGNIRVTDLADSQLR